MPKGNGAKLNPAGYDNIVEVRGLKKVHRYDSYGNITLTTYFCFFIKKRPIAGTIGLCNIGKKLICNFPLDGYIMTLFNKTVKRFFVVCLIQHLS